MITRARLETFLEVMAKQSPDEWMWQKSKLGIYWLVEYKPSYPPFQFYIEFNDEMLFVQCILADYRMRAESLGAISYLLLRLNEELSLVKFGLTPLGVISLMGELPAKAFSLDSFENLLRLMIHCLEQNYWEIGAVAESSKIADLIPRRLPYMRGIDQRIEGLVKSIEVVKLGDQQGNKAKSA